MSEMDIQDPLKRVIASPDATVACGLQDILIEVDCIAMVPAAG
jgi:hypothetical protein